MVNVCNKPLFALRKPCIFYVTDVEQENPEFSEERLCLPELSLNGGSLVKPSKFWNEKATSSVTRDVTVKDSKPQVKTSSINEDFIQPCHENDNQPQSSYIVNEVDLLVNSDDSVNDPDYETSSSSSDESVLGNKKPAVKFLKNPIENISDSSDESANLNELGSNGEQMVRKKCRKRQRNPDSWECNVRKRKRLSGKEYICRRKTLIEAKSLGPPCKDTCRFKCFLNITPEQRRNIFKMFWSPSKSVELKRQFVASSVHLVDVKRRRSRTGERENKKTYNRKFTFSIDGVQTEVCKVFFLNTLAISQTFVSTALSKKLVGGMTEADQRGKKVPPNKIPADAKDSIRNHISQFPTIQSHYSRERSSKKYLDSSLTIAKMYDIYREEMLANNVPENEIPKAWLYYEIFNNEFNYSFKLPDNDTCDQCDEFLIKLKDSSGEERHNIQEQYDKHLEEASKRYDLKNKDKKNAQNSTNQKCLTVDLEKCLPTPTLTNAQSFYSLKLWTFNYTIKDTTKNITSCCMWDESVAGRGGNEIASCLMKYLATKIEKSTEDVTIWSDNCPSQNRNINAILAYIAFLKLIPTLKVINHKYLLRGHTHLEVDSDHSLIERATKKMPKFQIMTPWDWQQLVRLASTRFSVVNMEATDFKDFLFLINGSNAPLMHRKKCENGKDFKISKLVHIQLRSDQPGKVFCKSSFDQNDFDILDLNRNTRKSIVFPDEIPVIRNVPKPIGEKKYKHLQNLLKWVPRMFHAFYQNLPHSDAVGDED